MKDGGAGYLIASSLPRVRWEDTNLISAGTVFAIYGESNRLNVRLSRLQPARGAPCRCINYRNAAAFDSASALDGVEVNPRGRTTLRRALVRKSDGINFESIPFYSASLPSKIPAAVIVGGDSAANEVISA